MSPTGFICIANAAISVAFILCYAYQLFYTVVSPLWGKDKRRTGASSLALLRQPGTASYAVLIAARNEAAVIGDLLDNLHNQCWQGALTVFVCADNCTDDTSAVATRHGAKVYCRSDNQRVGKGYALDFLLQRIQTDYGRVFDGYFVFDADNLVAPDYITEADKMLCAGYAAVTGYRNTKNYGDNWISAGYALWFLRESEFLNRSRWLLGSSAAVSGTGFAFTNALLQRLGGWHYYLLTEDLQFTADTVLTGEKIGYCPTAAVYDEQPISFSQSWRQRLRWVRGSLQVCRQYGGRLLWKAIQPGKRSFSARWGCFDMLMATMPAFLLSLTGVVCNFCAAGAALITGQGVEGTVISLAQLLGNSYLFMLALGVYTVLSQWQRIRASVTQKLWYTLTFPLFMMTYIPIAAAALFCRVQWKPIAHTRTASGISV